MITILAKRLDRVTLLRRYNSKSNSSGFTAAFALLSDDVKGGSDLGLKKFGKEHATTFFKPCPGNVYSTGVSIDFFSVEKSPAIAIRFTPTVLSDDDWVGFRSLLECVFNHGAKEVWESFKVSKLEIAVDVRAPFSEMVCFAPQITDVDISYLNSGTLYLGHRFGNRSYCIYDKRKQVSEVKHVDLGHDRTRIEVRHRHLGKTFGELEGMTAPFGRLIAVRKPALVRLMKQRPLDFELRAFVKAILSGCCAQFAYLDLDSYARKRITKLVRSCALQLNSGEKGWQSWFAQQQYDLRTRFLG